MELNVVEANAPEWWSGIQLFTHAEIQLLVHFELDAANRPRFIGASKKACFLCYCLNPRACYVQYLQVAWRNVPPVNGT